MTGMIGGGCKKDRGTTTCSAMMPGSKGQCKCQSGDCNDHGQCSDAPSRLFELGDQPLQILEEDHAVAMIAFGLFYYAGAVVAGVALVKRVVQNVRSSSQRSPEGLLHEDSEESGEQHLGE
jgi:hypothetical protein